jgi:formylglycine-generating enzyme required for sulfatase activity
VRGGAEWLLRRWGQRKEMAGIDRALATGKPEGGRRWYVNGQEQTMVLIDAHGPFLMGSPRTEAERFGGPEGREERQHRRRIGRTFALAAREVTVAQFRRFRPEHPYQKTYSPTDDHPINQVSWYQAAEYCNWLSKEEGIPPAEWCYEAHPRDGFAEGMRARPDFLGRKGYRLPTEAEWEYACRAGAVTARPHGETGDLLGAYAWYSGNSRDRETLPCGSLEPNGLGLFDMLGNAAEWCHDPAFFYQSNMWMDYTEDLKGSEYIKDRIMRVLRGGSFAFRARNVRCASRDFIGPAIRDYALGFRPARTCR